MKNGLRDLPNVELTAYYLWESGNSDDAITNWLDAEKSILVNKLVDET